MSAPIADNYDDGDLDDTYAPYADSQYASIISQAPCEAIIHRQELRSEIQRLYNSFDEGNIQFDFYDIKSLYSQLNQIDYLCNKTTLCSQIPRIFLRNMVEGIIVPIGENPINAMLNPLL